MEHSGLWMEELATWVKFAFEIASILVIVAGALADIVFRFGPF